MLMAEDEAAVKAKLMSPKSLRILVCTPDGQCYMNNGIPLGMCNFKEVVYDSVGTEPLIAEAADGVTASQGASSSVAQCCYCEYIVIREASARAIAHMPPNARYPAIHGAFFVLKYVTSEATMNRIQIEAAQCDQATIHHALCKHYGASTARGTKEQCKRNVNADKLIEELSAHERAWRQSSKRKRGNGDEGACA